ncbi:hypothetical protein APHAL10511_001708 [Amanita phalloides]|nr:hypothetical protein APHAL10511_001708 [Amanita phalloides]
MSIAHAAAPDISARATDPTKKRKKKRHRDDQPDSHKEHKKRKMDTETQITDDSLRHKNKKTTVIVDHNMDVSTQASTATLLSTIVAPVAGTPNISAQMPDIINPDPQQHYYPPLQYGFGPNPPFAPPMNLPFSELAFGSNDDILRALQDIDISKIANVLKTLEDAATAANVSLGALPSIVSSSSAPATSLGQTPVPSNTIISSASTDQDQGSLRRKVAIQRTTPDHAYLLANKWLNASKLAELVKAEGLVYKKGKFSATEEQQLKAAIENYRVAKMLTEEQLLEIIFPKNEKNKDNAFWTEITAAVPQRPIIAVYHHIRRSYHPLKLQGKWSNEEDALLKQAVADLGQQWEKVSERVGRMSSDCRDRYRNHIVNRDIRITGPWTKEEEEKLIDIVTKMTVEQGKGIDNDVFWGRVSEEMGGRRGRQQCRIKWTDALSKTVKNEGQKPRWCQQDAFILIHKIDSLDVTDDTEIDWKTLPDPAWNLWSAHSLQRRWLTMKRSVPHYESVSHQEIVDTLKSKKAAPLIPPPTMIRKRKERKVTSAAAIADADLQRDNTLGISGENSTKGLQRLEHVASSSDSTDAPEMY